MVWVTCRPDVVWEGVGAVQRSSILKRVWEFWDEGERTQRRIERVRPRVNEREIGDESGGRKTRSVCNRHQRNHNSE